MSKRLHIAIAEPSALIRCGLSTLLQRFKGLNIDVAEVSDISSVGNHSTYNILPDIIIIDPSNMGLYSPAQLKASLEYEQLKVVALQSGFNDQSILQGYDEVLSIYDSAETMQEKITAISESEPKGQGQKELSQREKEIIVCVVKGLSNKQIADELCLSTHTVIAHRRNITNKLQIHSPSGLTIYAIVNKLVDLADVKRSLSLG